jgi:hypothetical protein
MPNRTPLPPPPNTFDLGIVMAGAVSAGAYTAGVMDFLLEAMDEWEAAKVRGETVPGHQVKISAVSGASAGGMTAAILASLYNHDCPRVTSAARETTSANPLFESWVNKIDIAALLKDDDPTELAAASFLNCNIIDEIALRAFSANTEPKARPYLADDLALYLSVTNLRGVPYRIDFEAGTQTPQGHDLSRHQNAVKFVFGSPLAGGYALDAHAKRDEGNWLRMREAAVASGAFPIGLRPRRLFQPREQVEQHTWHVPEPLPGALPGSTAVTYEPKAIQPSWPSKVDNWLHYHPYGYWAIDGGVVDNEPLEQVRRHLAGPGGRNPRQSDKVKGTTLLIDPFVGWGPDDFVDTFADGGNASPKPPPWWSIAGQMFNAAKQQARFKPEELLLAQLPEVYSRYLIAPEKTNDKGLPLLSPFAIACGCLGGFGGFLAREFRVHDFLLGRRNCQRFLEKHYALDVTHGVNPRFGYNTPEEAQKSGFAFLEDGRWYMPIIPLVGSAKLPLEDPRWPAFYDEARLAELKKAIAKRLDHVVDASTRQMVGGFKAWLLRRVWDAAGGEAVDAIEKAVKKGLVDHKLWSEKMT